MRLRFAALLSASAAAWLACERTAAAEDFSMDAAVRMALERNRDVIAARLEIRAAEVDRAAAGVYWNPVFTYSMNNVVLGQGNPQGQGLTPGPFSQTVQTFAVGEVVDVWMKRSARIRAADLGIEQRRLRVEDALREIVFAVRLAYLDLAREQEEDEIVRTMNGRYAETVRLARARVAAGEISPADGQKFELEGLKYQNALIEADLELDLARERLAALLALPSRAQLPGKAFTPASQRTPPALAPLVARGLANRPDLLAAKKGRAWADASLASQRREAFPDISLGVGYTHDEFTVSGDNANSLALWVSLPLPLFDRNQGGIGHARVDADRADNEVARLTLVVQHEVAEAVRRLERSDALLDVYEDGGMLSRADNALAVAEKSYKAGASSLLELLEAQRTFIETRQQYLAAQDDWRKQTAAVLHATGERATP